MGLSFKILSLDEIKEIYYSDMVEQFPDNERRSYGNIADMVRKEMYAGYGLYDNGEICAYALAALFPEQHAILLDYLAAMKGKKGKGYGSEMLRRLRSYFPDTDRILIETEDPDVLPEPDRSIAQRRLGFYTRNGYRETGVHIHLFSVLYRLYVQHAEQESDESLLSLMEKLYRRIVPAKMYDANVHLFLR